MTWDEEVAALRETVAGSFGVLRRTPYEALRWVTTVIAVYVVTLDDDVTARACEAVDAYHAQRRIVCQRSGRISRHPQGQTRWAGVVEIDLIHPKIARLCSKLKASLLAEMGVDVAAPRSDQRIVVVHEHALYDHRGHPAAAILMRDLRAAWPGPRRLHAAKLYETGTVAQNVSRLADYCVKFRFQYCAAWNGRKTTFLSEYESSWRTYVQRIYQTIGVGRLLNASIKTQASAAEEAHRMYGEQPTSVGETAKIGSLQLSQSEDTEMTINNLIDMDYRGHPQPSGEHEDTMRAHEIIDKYVDPKVIDPEYRQELEDALERQGPLMTSAMLYAMYGNHERELDLEQQRLDAEKTRAEIARLCAAAHDLRAGNPS